MNLENLKPGWYCFRATVKKEHLAAKLLNAEEDIEAFCPRISYEKNTRRGKVRFVEAFFPGYVFVNCDLKYAARKVLSINGVTTIVSYGEQIPRLSEAVINDLKDQFSGDSHEAVADPILQEGQTVTIIDGPLKETQAVISGVDSSAQRVAILLEMLGRQVSVSVSFDEVKGESDNPRLQLQKPEPEATN